MLATRSPARAASASFAGRTASAAKGKRSGSRTIYPHVALVDVVHLLLIYDHEDKDDLTPNERKELAAYAHELKTMARRGRGS